jgi:hypothetical protein
MQLLCQHTAAAIALLPSPNCRHRHDASTHAAELPPPMPATTVLPLSCRHHNAAHAAAPLPSGRSCRAAVKLPPLSPSSSCCTAATATTAVLSLPPSCCHRCHHRAKLAPQHFRRRCPVRPLPHPLVDDCHVPPLDSSALTPRPWQHNCSASTLLPRCHRCHRQTAVTAITLLPTLPRCGQAATMLPSPPPCRRQAAAAAKLLQLPPPPC